LDLAGLVLFFLPGGREGGRMPPGNALELAREWPSVLRRDGIGFDLEAGEVEEAEEAGLEMDTGTMLMLRLCLLEPGLPQLSAACQGDTCQANGTEMRGMKTEAETGKQDKKA